MGGATKSGGYNVSTVLNDWFIVNVDYYNYPVIVLKIQVK